MSDNELTETFDLDDRRAEIVPALNKGNSFSINICVFGNKIVHENVCFVKELFIFECNTHILTYVCSCLL